MEPKELKKVIGYLEDYYSTFGCDENDYKDFYTPSRKRYHTNLKKCINSLKPIDKRRTPKGHVI